MGTQEGGGGEGRAPAGIVEFYYYYPKRSISIGKLSECAFKSFFYSVPPIPSKIARIYLSAESVQLTFPSIPYSERQQTFV